MINSLKFKVIGRDLISIHCHRLSMAIFGNPIIVYHMPKTGSASITASLKKIGYYNAFHIHNLNPNDSYPFKYSKKLAAFLNTKIHNSNMKFKVITCVRDPIARNISDLFQFLKIAQRFHSNGLKLPFYFSSSEKFFKQGMNAEQIQELFYNDYPYHNLPLTWLDENINRNLGIDIYDYDFPIDKGYIEISRNNIELLVLKLEIDDLMKEKIIANFIKNEQFKLVRTNITNKEKFSYSHLYRDFIKTIKIPQDYVNKMYNSKFVNYFYSYQEIDKMKRYWLTSDRN